MGLFTRSKYWQRGRKEPRHSTTAITPSPSKGANLLTLPPEIRLNIFEHVFDNQEPFVLFNGSDTIVLVNSALSDSEEHTDKSNRRNRTHLLRVSRQIRNEAVDVFFDCTVFGIVAYLYQAPAKASLSMEGPRAMPYGFIPMSTLRRIKKLLIVTELRSQHYARVGYRVGDLRYLQAMTALKQIRIIVKAPTNFLLGVLPMAPIRAILESIPLSTCVKIGPELKQPLWWDGLERFCESTDDLSRIAAASGYKGGRPGRLYTYVHKYVETISERQGILSGSTVDHSLCSFHKCVEGKGCVNSEMETPPPKVKKAVSRLLHGLGPKGRREE